MDIGNEVYFYCSAPIKRIVMKGIVSGVNVEFEDSIEDSKFYMDKLQCKSNNGMTYTRIKLLEMLPEEKSQLLTLDLLKKHGLKGNIQSTQMINKKEELF